MLDFTLMLYNLNEKSDIYIGRLIVILNSYLEHELISTNYETEIIVRIIMNKISFNFVL